MRTSGMVRRGILACLTAFAALAMTPGLAAARQTGPTPLSLSTTVLVPGQDVYIFGDGYNNQTQFQADVCGDSALNGSADCSGTGASAFTPWPDGSVHGMMRVVKPPVPCPCVVQITETTSDAIQDIPVTVTGMPVSSSPPMIPSSISTPTLTVQASILGGTNFPEALGFAANRTIRLVVQNSSASAVTSTLVVRWGKGFRPTNVVPSARSYTFGPNSTTTITLPLRIDPLTFGSVNVVGSFTGSDASVGFSTSTSPSPWLLPFVVLAAIAALVVFIVRRRNEEPVGGFESAYAALLAVSMPGGETEADAAAVPELAATRELHFAEAYVLGDAGAGGQSFRVSQLSFDQRGVVVTATADAEPRVMPWNSVFDLSAHAWLGTDPAYGPSVMNLTGSVVVCRTMFNRYQFLIPNTEPMSLEIRLENLRHASTLTTA